MNHPPTQVPNLLNSLLAAKSPTDQLHYLRKYVTSDASLISPLHNISPSPHSRDNYISRALLFFRLWVKECDVKVRRWAWNEKEGTFFIEVEIIPVVRGVVGIRENLGGYLGWMGGEKLARLEVWERWRGWSISGLVVLGLRNDGAGSWRVEKIDVLGQPATLLESLRMNWVADILYNTIWLSTSLSVTLGQTLNLWTPSQFSARDEMFVIHRDVANLYISLKHVYLYILFTLWRYYTLPFRVSLRAVGCVYNWLYRDHVRITIERTPRVFVEEIHDGAQYIVRERIPEARVGELRQAVAVVKERVGDIDGLKTRLKDAFD